MPQRHRLAPADAVPPGTGKAFEVAGRRIAVFNAAGRFYAIDDTCPHAGAPLSEGSLDGTTVVCPWHDARFDVTCGKVLGPPADRDVGSYPVALSGGMIEVEV